MGRRLAWIGASVAVAFAAGVLVAGRASTEEPPAGGMTPEAAEMMKTWERLMRPGPEHKVLEGLVGSWEGKGTWTDAGMSASFTETFAAKMVYGGRFLQVDSTMTSQMAPEMPPMTMTSLMFVGFDNAKRKYVQTMVGDMSTSIGSSEGTYDAATKTFVMQGVEHLGEGKSRKFRMAQKIVSPTEWTFEMYFTQPDGKEAKAIEAVYKKQ